MKEWNGELPDVNYTISDGEGGTSNAHLKIKVIPVNDAPVAVGSIEDQSNEDASNANVTLDLANLFADIDNPSEGLTYSAANLPQGLNFDPQTGKITGTIDNSASQGGSNNDGKYTVTITATDPGGLTVEQTFIWTVTNPAPEALDDAGETLKSVELSVIAEDGVLKNDTDSDGDNLTVSSVTGEGGESVANPDGSITVKATYGTLTLQTDGSYVYTPNAEATGTDSFTFAVSDGVNEQVTAMVDITIEVLEVDFAQFSRAAFNQAPTDKPLSVNGRTFTNADAKVNYDDLLTDN